MLVSIGGIRLNVLDEGSGDPVLFLHGIGGEARNWAPQMDEFQKSYRTLAVDTRGYGCSDRTYGTMTVADYAEDVVALVDALELDRPVLVGLSMGGMIAQHVVAVAPERFRGVALCNTTTKADESLRGSVGLAREAAREHGMVAVGEAFLAAVFASTTISEGRTCVRDFERGFTSTDPLTFVLGLEAITDLDLTSSIENLDLPTLVIHGNQDVVMPLHHGEMLAKLIPGAELGVIDGAGHLSNLDDPKAFNGHLRGFLHQVLGENE